MTTEETAALRDLSAAIRQFSENGRALEKEIQQLGNSIRELAAAIRGERQATVQDSPLSWSQAIRGRKRCSK